MYLFKGYYHLWYMLAILYTIILLWFLSKNQNILKCFYYLSFFLLMIGIMMFGYGNVFFKIPLIAKTLGMINTNINMQSEWLFSIIPFFMVGYGMKNKNRNCSWVYKNCEILLVVFLVAYIFEILFLQIFDLKNSTTLCLTTYPLVYLLILFSTKHPQIGTAKLAKYSSGIASFTYFSHILFIDIFEKLNFSETPTYFITIAFTAFLGFAIVKSNNSIFKKLI